MHVLHCYNCNKCFPQLESQLCPREWGCKQILSFHGRYSTTLVVQYMRYKEDCQDRSFTEFGDIDWHFELRCSLRWHDKALKCLLCSDLVNCSWNKAYLITDWIGGMSVALRPQLVSVQFLICLLELFNTYGAVTVAVIIEEVGLKAFENLIIFFHISLADGKFHFQNTLINRWHCALLESGQWLNKWRIFT